MKKIIYILLFIGFSSTAQTEDSALKTVKLRVVSDTIQIDSISISPYKFKLFDQFEHEIDSSKYQIDFAKAQLILDHRSFEQITIQYKSLPQFLTDTYFKFDKNFIAPQATDLTRLYKIKKPMGQQLAEPFDGLITSGSISRGLTLGNNQNAVVNSNLDLQISGNLSKDVQLRASITDTNIPLQENGFTQRLDEFDRVFIELFSEKWRLQAGDINLTNTGLKFLKFQKKVAGVLAESIFEDEKGSTRIFASGALVRGQFARREFFGQEGNQGPYNIRNSNEQQFILLISDSERVYVNGLLLERGEHKDYVINYNTAEIIFNATYPVNASMRIIVEYQFSERNYTRFVTYNGAEYTSEKLTLGLNFYNENDAKNQATQQDLTNNQKEILSMAGDDINQMVVPSAVVAVYDENKIQYKKEIQNGMETFVFSNDNNDALFNVRFTYVGENQGNYMLQSTIATGRIYEYTAAINTIPQGAYEPIIQLVAPNKLQLAVFSSSFNPTDKTSLDTELAYSLKDENLFSAIDDNNNQGFAGKLGWKQLLIDGEWKLKSVLNIEYITKNFSTIERFRDVEFRRDWTLTNPLGNQQFLNARLTIENDEKGSFSYQFDKLDYSENFTGNKHNINSYLSLGQTKIKTKGHFLNSSSTTYDTKFLRWYSSVEHHFKKAWIGAKFNAETNELKELSTALISDLSHRFKEYESYIGLGDSTKVYAELGFNSSLTDSLKINGLERVNSTKTYFLRSQILHNKTSNLAVFLNYRTVNNVFFNNEKAFNSRLTYQQDLFKGILNLQTVLESSSGSLAQQEFSYIEVDTGLGFYTWNDYNDNGIKELDEFEVAQFQDEANYVRVLLPSINFVKTDQNKFSQSLTINPSRWAIEKGFKKFLSHFINQSFVLIDAKNPRNNNSFNFNPFQNNNEALSLIFNLKNSLYFNRAKQKYSTTYNYIKTRNRNSFSIGDQENSIETHQLLFNHKLAKFWLFDLKTVLSQNRSNSQSFSSRNFLLDILEFEPKLTYLLNQNSRFELSYQFKNKENLTSGLEQLVLNKFGASFLFAPNRKYSLNGNISLVFNAFTGNLSSPVAYQMLEGLQEGTNFVWTSGFQKKINSFLDLNFNYFGRKSATSKTIHTGSIQLRASF